MYELTLDEREKSILINSFDMIVKGIGIQISEDDFFIIKKIIKGIKKKSTGNDFSQPSYDEKNI